MAKATQTLPKTSNRVPTRDAGLSRVVSDMESPLRDLDNLIDALLWVAMGLEANSNEASASIYGMHEVLSEKAEAIRAVWQDAHDSRFPARED